MANKKTASDTVKTQLASLTMQNAALIKERDEKAAENEKLRKQNVELASIIENDLKADTIVRIVAMSSYKEQDLENLKIEELQQIEETLMKTKGADKLPYKSIRAGAAQQGQGRLTVGTLYGKSREEILEMGGEM